MIEIIIFIIEAVYYFITLRKKDGARAGIKAVVYAAVANLTSLIMGGIIYAKVWFEMFNKTLGIAVGWIGGCKRYVDSKEISIRYKRGIVDHVIYI